MRLSVQRSHVPPLSTPPLRSIAFSAAFVPALSPSPLFPSIHSESESSTNPAAAAGSEGESTRSQHPADAAAAGSESEGESEGGSKSPSSDFGQYVCGSHMKNPCNYDTTPIIPTPSAPIIPGAGEMPVHVPSMGEDGPMPDVEPPEVKKARAAVAAAKKVETAADADLKKETAASAAAMHALSAAARAAAKTEVSVDASEAEITMTENRKLTEMETREVAAKAKEEKDAAVLAADKARLKNIVDEQADVRFTRERERERERKKERHVNEERNVKCE